VARRLRRDDRFAGVTIMAITGWGAESDRQQARAAGFDHHLTKPVEPAAAEAILQSVAQSCALGGAGVSRLPQGSPPRVNDFAAVRDAGGSSGAQGLHAGSRPRERIASPARQDGGECPE
jgi:DNA-binding response OmpR family regulator